MKYYLSFVLVLVLFMSCKNDPKTEMQNTTDIHKVTAQEVINVNEYTYVRVLEDGVENWIAAPLTDIKVGETYYYGNAIQMQNFKSEELNKTFETVYFVQKISKTEKDNQQSLVSSPASEKSGSQRLIAEKKDITIETSGNTITIEELLKNKEKYNNEIVRLKGEVTKYNPAIMNVNWVHIQDGTAFNNIFDLTVTTTAEVNLGDIISFEGKVILNKDFGAGYVYEIIIENATIIE